MVHTRSDSGRGKSPERRAGTGVVTGLDPFALLTILHFKRFFFLPGLVYQRFEARITP
jgi:hypothetical protein